MNHSFRQASITDGEFLSKVIIEAEKSGSNLIGLAKIFGLSDDELQSYLIQMLEEEIEGCEISISSFVIAENNGLPIASFGGWIEEENEDDQSSSILKSNLIGFTLPPNNLIILRGNQEILKDIQIAREPHSHQLEYAFVDKNHRGEGIIDQLIEQLLSNAVKQNSRVTKSQVQVFENNK